MNFACRVVIPKHVEVKRSRVLPDFFPDFNVWCCPSSCQNVIISFSKVDQFGERVIQASVEPNDQLKVNVGVKVDFAIGSVLNLFQHKPVATEHSQRGPCVIRGDVELIAAADLHGKKMSLEIVVEGGDFRAGMVVDVSNPSGVCQVSVKKLKVLSQTGFARDAPSQPIIPVDHGPATALTVNASQKPLGAVFKDFRASLTQEAILVQPVLNITQTGDSVTQVVAERRQACAAAGVQQVEVPIEVIVVPPHDLLVQVHRLELAIDVVLVSVLGSVGEGPYFNLSLGDPAHVIILDGNPVHERPEYLILDLLDAAMSIKVLRVSHYGCGDDLVDVIVYNPKFPKLLNFARNVVKLVKVNGQGGLIDDTLHAGHSEAVVVAVVESCVYHPIFTEAENLPVNQGANLPVSNGANKAITLQVHCFQDSRCLIIGKADSRAVVENFREPGLPSVLEEDPPAGPQESRLQEQPFLVVVRDDGGVALWGVVYVAVIADGPDGLHGVASHAGHGDGRQAVPHVVFEDVLPLAMEQEHHGL